MKKIFIATLALSSIAVLFFLKRKKRTIQAEANLLTKRAGNREKHLTTVFAKAKTMKHETEEG